MNTFSYHRELPQRDFEVAVLGGGPTGVAAAVAAARHGRKSVLIETTGALGGMASSGLVPSFAPFSDGRRLLYGGIALEIFEQLKRGMRHVAPGAQHWVPIDPELLKRQLDELVTAAGVEVCFNTLLVDAEREGSRLTRAVVADKSGLWGCRAAVYIDATGDADLAARAGVPFASGDEHGELMPASHCFILANVDEYSMAHDDYPWGHARPGSWRYRMLHSGKYDLTDGHTCVAHLGPGVFGFNAGHHWQVDPARPETVSRALMAGRRIAAEFRAALAEFHPAFRNAFLVATAPLMGIRESRRIQGDYVLTLDDYLARRDFPDSIARNCYPIDLHAAAAEIEDARSGRFEAMKRFEPYRPGESHAIPYRSLLPRTLDNLLVAGRSLSCERLVQAAIRVIPNCLATGEAAGTAAALAGASGNCRAVAIPELQAELRRTGGVL